MASRTKPCDQKRFSKSICRLRDNVPSSLLASFYGGFLKCAAQSCSIHPEFEWEIVGTRQLWHFVLILKHCILQFFNNSNSNTPHPPHNGSLQNHQNHPASPTFSRSQQKFLLVAICAYHLCNATREKSDRIASRQSLSDGFGILGSIGEVRRTDGIC